MATATRSDDPMDLGGFMQNFVLSNPFKDLPSLPTKEAAPAAAAPVTTPPEPQIKQEIPDLSPLVGKTSKGESTEGSPVSGTKEDRVVSDRVVSDENGQVVDTPKAHVGSNVVFAAALKLQKVSGAHAKVQKWLQNNYIHEASYPACKSAKELSSEVQTHFPHITNMTLSKIMTFTFPQSNKVTNISGFHGYKGLLAKPQPEDYCNLDLLKSVSHCKLYGSITAAAQLYGVNPDSVASLYYWHPDLSSLPVHMSVAEELQRQVDSNGPYDLSQHSHSPSRRPKRRTLPTDLRDPDTLANLENENGNQRLSSRLAERKIRLSLKEEDMVDELGDGELTELSSEENQATYSLLRNLLKRPRLPGDAEPVQNPNPPLDDLPQDLPQDLPLDLHTGVVVKSEPVDTGYGDSTERSSSEKSDERRKRKERLRESTEDSESGESRLRAEVQRLKSKINNQIAKNQKQEVQLLLSQKEVLSLKSSLCSHQVTFTELSQDFANLQDQFCSLNRKFKRALEQLEKDKEDVADPPRKKKKVPTATLR